MLAIDRPKSAGPIENGRAILATQRVLSNLGVTLRAVVRHSVKITGAQSHVLSKGADAFVRELASLQLTYVAWPGAARRLDLQGFGFGHWSLSELGESVN
jgi:hypothetical protein